MKDGQTTIGDALTGIIPTESTPPGSYDFEEAERKRAERKRKEAAAYWIEKSNLPAWHLARTIDATTAGGKWAKCLTAAKAKLAERGWVMLLGNVGAGKTQIITEILRGWCEDGKPAVYCTLSSMLAMIRACYDEGGGSEWKAVSRLGECPILAIDEIDRAKLTPWGDEKLGEVIDARYRGNRPLIIAGNCNAEGLAGLLGERLVDRIMERGFVLQFGWQSLRRPPSNEGGKA